MPLGIFATRGVTMPPRRLILLFVLLTAAIPLRGVAQSSTPTSAVGDSMFRRARRMVSEGNGAAGRALVDSLLRREEEGTTAFGNAVYWRGALAETAAEAERDYRKVIVEYPLSPYASDALLAIAELEQARGDRAGALAHLQRFVREHPVSSARGIAALAASRLAFEQRDTRTGCAMIVEARASASATEVELRNQIDYYATRCPAAPVGSSAVAATTPPSIARDSTPVPVTAPAKKSVRDTVAPVRKPARDSATVKPSSSPPKAAARGIHTIQVAAYPTRAAADQLVAKLAARGVKARVSGSTKPFRVRLDFYQTRAAAESAVVSLKERGIIGFVTTEPAASDRASP